MPVGRGNRFFVGTITFNDPAVADETICSARSMEGSHSKAGSAGWPSLAHAPAKVSASQELPGETGFQMPS
jgi:hypothetical protein